VSLTQKQKMLVALVLLVLAALGGGYYKYGRPRLAEYKQAAVDRKQAENSLTQARQKYYNYSNPEDVISKIRAIVDPWEADLVRAKRIYNSTERTVPQGIQFREFFFRDEFKKTQEAVVAKAREKNIRVFPENLGFPDMIPDSAAVGMLLNQLNNAKFVLEVLIDSGAVEISRFVVGKRILHRGFVQILPFEVTILITVEDLVKLLDKVVRTTQYLSVHSIGMRGEQTLQGKFVLRVDMVLFTLRLLDKNAVDVSGGTTTPGPGDFMGDDMMGGPRSRYMRSRFRGR